MAQTFQRPTVREVFTVPNVIGYVRILVIPVFMHFYLTAADAGDYRVSTAVAGLSAVSDFLDGLIARRCGQVTDLGKIVDPLADKLSQAGMIFCLATRYPFMLGGVILFAVKELFMGVMGLCMLRHNGRKLNGARWWGKVCTAVLYVCLFIMFWFPRLDLRIARALTDLCVFLMLFCLGCYIPVFRRMWREPPLPG